MEARTRMSDRELAAQICVTGALHLADQSRAVESDHAMWMQAATIGNDRTRESMIERGVVMFTRRERRSVGK